MSVRYLKKKAEQITKFSSFRYQPNSLAAKFYNLLKNEKIIRSSVNSKALRQ